MSKLNIRTGSAFGKAAMGVVLLTATAAPSLANDTVDAVIGNTWVWTSVESGEVVKDYLTADGRFTMDNGASGTWTLDGDELCFTEAAGAWTGCVIVPGGYGVGQSFEMTGFDGKPWMTEIVAGQ